MTRAKNRDAVVRSSGNVFADLGLRDAGRSRPKSAWRLRSIRLWKDTSLAGRRGTALGINQPKISALANYRLDGFSVERLMNFLNSLGRDVEIVIRKSRSRRAAELT